MISLVSIFKHARNYYVPKQQRQIIRILWMPAVYAGEFGIAQSFRSSSDSHADICFHRSATVVSFFSYRFFRAYTYYSVAVTAYESLVVSYSSEDSFGKKGLH